MNEPLNKITLALSSYSIHLSQIAGHSSVLKVTGFKKKPRGTDSEVKHGSPCRSQVDTMNSRSYPWNQRAPAHLDRSPDSATVAVGWQKCRPRVARSSEFFKRIQKLKKKKKLFKASN